MPALALNRGLDVPPDRAVETRNGSWLVHRVRRTEATGSCHLGSQHCRSQLAGDQTALAAAKIARKRAPTSRPLRAATIGLGISAVLHSRQQSAAAQIRQQPGLTEVLQPLDAHPWVPAATAPIARAARRPLDCGSFERNTDSAWLCLAGYRSLRHSRSFTVNHAKFIFRRGAVP